MASSSLNSEGQKKIRVMSLDYIKSSIIRKTSTNSVCICKKDVGLNLDDEVEHATTDLDGITVNDEHRKHKCKYCGRTVRSRNPGLFKFLRKRFCWKTNSIGSGSINSKSKYSSNNKLISDASDCAFPSMPSDFNSKDNNLNYNVSVDKTYCDVTVSEVVGNSTKCNSNDKVTDEISNSGKPSPSCNEMQLANVLESTDLVLNKVSCGDDEPPPSDNDCLSSDSNYDVDSKIIEPYSQFSEVLPLPSPKTRSLTCELLKLSKYGWYWGPISREEAEEKLQDQPDGAFLVRDSSADHYLLSLSFRSSGKLLHTRIEHSQGLFSFYHQPEQEGFATIGELIDHSVSFSQSAVFCYSRPRSPGHPAFPVRLTKPVSRFTQVRSLQYLCRFVIRQYIRVDNIENLPLPNTIKGYIQEGHY